MPGVLKIFFRAGVIPYDSHLDFALRGLHLDGFPSTRTEGPTNLGRCTYVSVSDLTRGSGVELVATKMSLERYLQGRKLECDFPVRWSRIRVLGD